MAVVPFPMDLSPQGLNPSMSWELRSLTGKGGSPLSGVVRTLERPGAHWAATLPYENLADARQARLQNLAASLRGHANRTYVPVFGWTRRGSFTTSELLTNNDFASGTTGWEINTANEAVLTASDSILRVTRAANTASYVVRQAATATVTQYAPYAARALTMIGRGAYVAGTGQVYIGSTAQGTAPTDYGMHTAAFVSLTTSAQFGFADIATGKVAGDSFRAGYTSLARCALVDNGQNRLVRSDEFDNASWTKSACSISANSATSPIGTNIGDSIIEDSGTSTHFVSQAVTVSSAVADFAFSVALRAGSRTFAWLSMSDGTDDVTVYVNLSTGVVATPSSSGANFVNERAFARPAGNGWHIITLVGTKASSSTTVTCRCGLATALGTSNYAGDGSSYIDAWRATLAQSGVPTRLIETAATADSDGTLQTGSGLYLKGLPASTNGLLLQDDPAEIIQGTTGQLVRTRGALNSDAAGLGYFEFEAPLRVSPSDNAAVIVENPLCKMMLDANNVGWTDRVAGLSDLELSFVEDTFPS